MNCPTCGAQNAAEARFCAECGVTLAPQSAEVRSVIYCNKCGRENSSEARFCVDCGSVIQGRIGRGTPPRSSLVTAEYMGFWIRLTAQIIDGIILGIAWVILLALTNALPVLIIIVIPVFIYGFYKYIKGKTLGKMLLRIAVVDETGQEISFGRGLLREIIGKFASGIIFCLGYIWVAFDDKNQGWHDKIAGTYVVRKR